MFVTKGTINKAELSKLGSCIMLEVEKKQKLLNSLSLPSSQSKIMSFSNWTVVSAQHFSRLKVFSNLLLKQCYFLRIFLNKHQQKNLWYSMILLICEAHSKQSITQNTDNPPHSLSLLHLNLITLKWQERRGNIKLFEERVLLIISQRVHKNH